MPKHDFRSVHLPFCLKRLDDGRYVVLNRDYKPLGFSTTEHIEYQAYPIAAKFKGLTAEVAAKISWEGNENLAEIWLYHDSCTPTKSDTFMKAYLERLQTLAKLQFEQADS